MKQSLRDIYPSLSMNDDVKRKKKLAGIIVKY
jgi:hypothetical protein